MGSRLSPEEEADEAQGQEAPGRWRLPREAKTLQVSAEAFAAFTAVFDSLVEAGGTLGSITWAVEPLEGIDMIFAETNSTLEDAIAGWERNSRGLVRVPTTSS